MSRECGWIERAGYQVDRVIKVFAPGWAWKRVQAKAAVDVFSAYHGGASNRLRKDWVPGVKGATGLDDGTPREKDQRRTPSKNPLLLAKTFQRSYSFGQKKWPFI